MTYRHCLCFGNFDEADKAETYINEQIDDVTDSCQTNDDETGASECVSVDHELPVALTLLREPSSL
jgi:hypothetical protein